MKLLKQKMHDFFCDDRGATAVEYALFAASIAGVIVAIVFSLGGSVNSLFVKANTEFGKAIGSSTGN